MQMTNLECLWCSGKCLNWTVTSFLMAVHLWLRPLCQHCCAAKCSSWGFPLLASRLPNDDVIQWFPASGSRPQKWTSSPFWVGHASMRVNLVEKKKHLDCPVLVITAVCMLYVILMRANENILDVVTPYTPARSLRSATANRLVTPSLRANHSKSRLFAVLAPHWWNELKTHLFRLYLE